LTEDDEKQAEIDLRNWGRFMFDGWLDDNLLIQPPPTSEGYLAPIVGFDEPEPVKMPIDYWSGQIAEHVIVSIGGECGGFDSYVSLVHWYTRLIFVECTQRQRYKRLSKHMHCSFKGAKRIHVDARARYWDRRAVINDLIKMYRIDMA